MKGRQAGRRSLAAPATLSRPVVHPLPSRLPPLSFRCFPHGQRGHVPVVMETRANRDGNSTVGRSPSSPPFLSLSLSLFRFLRHRFSPSVPLPLRQRANVFASRSLCRFQIISRPIVLLLTTRRPLCPHPLIVPATKSSPPRPRAPSLASRPVSLV